MDVARALAVWGVARLAERYPNLDTEAIDLDAVYVAFDIERAETCYGCGSGDFHECSASSGHALISVAVGLLWASVELEHLDLTSFLNEILAASDPPTAPVAAPPELVPARQRWFR
jgi:hypothetical protein